MTAYVCAISDLSFHTNIFFFFFNVGLEKEATEPREPNHAILANLCSPHNKQAAQLCSLLPAWNTGLVFRCPMYCMMVLRLWRGKPSTKGDDTRGWWDPEVLIPLLTVVVQSTDPSTGMPVLKTKPSAN